MHNKILLLASVLLIGGLTCACSFDDIDGLQAPMQEVELTIQATAPDFDVTQETKTSVETINDVPYIFWSPGDAISLFYGSGDAGGNKFVSVITEKAKVSNFYGTIGVITGGGDISIDDTYFWAVYPYSESTSCSGQGITAELPSTQISKAGSFTDGQNLTVGRSHALIMPFYNVCSYLKVVVSTEGIRSITLKNKDGGVLAGTFQIGFNSNEKPVVNSVSNGSDKITLKPYEGATFIPGQTYYFVFKPVTMSQGFDVIYRTATTEATYHVTSSQTFERNNMVKRILNKDASLTWEPFTGNIEFADANFKQYLVDCGYDSDHDGEISYDEAKRITYLNFSTDNITSLGGIEYFTNLQTLSCRGSRKDVSWENNEEITTYWGKLTELDLSCNEKLTYLCCDRNPITSLNINGCTALYYVCCRDTELSSLDLSGTPELETLECNSCKIEDLDFSRCPKLVSIYCRYNNLSALDLSANPKLKYLNCRGNTSLSTLSLNPSVSLIELSCSSTQISSLDVTGMTDLESIDVSYCPLTAIDLTHNTKLTSISVNYVNMGDWDVSKYPNLLSLGCSDCGLTALDLTANPKLTRLNCGFNYLSTLDLSECLMLTYVYVNKNPNLVEVWLRTGAEIGELYYESSVTTIKYKGERLFDEGNIEFEDANFKAACLNYCDNNHDGEVSYAEAYSCTYLYAGGYGIASLKGIEHFPNLESLYCNDNQISELNLSTNTKLYELIVDSNQITELDLSANTSLERLSCSYNQISALDLSANTSLRSLSVSDNNLTSLDISSNTRLTSLWAYQSSLKVIWVSDNFTLESLTDGYSFGDAVFAKKSLLTDETVVNIPDANFKNYLLERYDVTGNGEISQGEAKLITNMDLHNKDISSLVGVEYMTNLETLSCDHNNLTSLDVSACTKLRDLQCNNNMLTSLDISGCSALEYLYCYSNKLTTLDVTHNTALTYLNCANNQLSTLIVSNNTALEALYCQQNNLSTLDISNNTKITILDTAQNADGLKYIWVWDDFSISSFEFYRIDSAIFINAGTMADESEINIPDANFKSYLLTRYDINENGKISESEAKAITDINVNTRAISSLIGIEYMTNLTYLSCYGNQLTQLNVSANTALQTLLCHNNQITQLDLSANTNLAYFTCYDNQITELDLSANSMLQTLDCESNALTSLTFSKSSILNQINCGKNNLTTLDVHNLKVLRYLYCQGNKLETLDISANTNMITLMCVQAWDESRGGSYMRTLFINNGQAINGINKERSTECVSNDTDIVIKGRSGDGSIEGTGDILW